MIHMRPYNKFEETNVRFLVDKQIDFVSIQITETGLKKSIMDATAPVRTYLLEKGIHNYEAQLQGAENKRIVETVMLKELDSYPTKTSLYRPITKKGDPRLWINRIKDFDFLHADDIFALIAYEGRLYAVNISTTDIPKVCNSIIDSQLKDLIETISHDKNSVSEELLGLFRERMSDWIPAEISADTGIGRTVESVLGITMNSSKDPDYKGIELKSHRDKSKVQSALFTQTPDWSISRFKSGKDIVAAYGYVPEDHLNKTLQVTVRSNRPNAQKLGLKIKPEVNILEIDEFSMLSDSDGHFGTVQDVASWRLSRLHDRLLTKHHETFWIDVATKEVKGQEYFRCSKIEHTKNPNVSQFDVLMDQGQIYLDLMLCRPSGRGDTYSFKMRKSARPLLFPESESYSF